MNDRVTLKVDYSQIYRFMQWFTLVWRSRYGHRLHRPESKIMVNMYWSDNEGTEAGGTGKRSLRAFFTYLSSDETPNATILLCDTIFETGEKKNLWSFRLDFDEGHPFSDHLELRQFLDSLKLSPAWIIQTGERSYHALFVLCRTGEWQHSSANPGRIKHNKKMVDPIVDQVRKIRSLVPFADRSADPFVIKIPGTISKQKFVVQGYLTRDDNKVPLVDLGRWINWAENEGAEILRSWSEKNKELVDDSFISIGEKNAPSADQSDFHVETSDPDDLTPDWFIERRNVTKDAVLEHVQNSLPKYRGRLWLNVIADHLAHKVDFLFAGTERISQRWLSAASGLAQHNIRSAIRTLIEINILAIKKEFIPGVQARTYSWHPDFVQFLESRNIRRLKFVEMDAGDTYPAGQSNSLSIQDIKAGLSAGWSDQEIFEFVSDRLGNLGRQPLRSMIKYYRRKYETSLDTLSASSGSDSTPAHP